MSAVRLFSALLLIFVLTATGHSNDPTKPTVKTTDTDQVKRLNIARKEYYNSLVSLYQYYEQTGERERARWAEDELKSFHLANKLSFRVELDEVLSISLDSKDNIKTANDLFKEASKYKDKGSGADFVLNQRRAEILFQEILQKYPTSDKNADVLYQLAELYEGRAYKQYERAAVYFERVAPAKKGSRTDARLRSAYIYDKLLNERTKAIELYRDEITHDTDAERIKYAEKRLAELTNSKK